MIGRDWCAAMLIAAHPCVWVALWEPALVVASCASVAAAVVTLHSVGRIVLVPWDIHQAALSMAYGSLPCGSVSETVALR